MLRKNESLQKANERLHHENDSLLKYKELSDGQISALTKSLEALQKDLKDREKLVVTHTTLHLVELLSFNVCSCNYAH